MTRKRVEGLASNESVIEYIKTHPPFVRVPDLVRDLGFKDVNSAACRLNWLEKKGLVTSRWLECGRCKGYKVASSKTLPTVT